MSGSAANAAGTAVVSTVPVNIPSAVNSTSLKTGGSSGYFASFKEEFLASTDLLFQSKLTWLLAFGPLAIVGDATGTMGEALCFTCSGIALVPCAERLSFITEQVAEHTNGTIGALLNATFGNAPELLISVAALRAGYYRVVQLAMLGSMLTNMILVFGVSCVIGGLRWQVQELRTVSGNVNVVMLWVATAGSLFPAALKLSGQIENPSLTSNSHDEVTPEEVTFCRVNAAIMLVLYLCFLLFQLGTHKEEYDEDDIGFHSKRARRNLVCLSMVQKAQRLWGVNRSALSPPSKAHQRNSDVLSSDDELDDDNDEEAALVRNDEAAVGMASGHPNSEHENTWAAGDADGTDEKAMQNRRRRQGEPSLAKASTSRPKLDDSIHRKIKNSEKNLNPDNLDLSSNGGISMDGEEVVIGDDSSHHHLHPVHFKEGPLLSMRVGVLWLFIITVCISAMSDVLVETIDGFARRMRVSEVFTSMVIIPFFSNVAEQVSAFLFAYRNEMDLCIGVTVGSAIQIATFVLPGSVLIATAMDRNMTLFFRGYETVALLFAVVVISSILQGGTTNWMTGVGLVGIYIMLGTGIWFHELEELTIDNELLNNESLNFTSDTDV